MLRRIFCGVLLWFAYCDSVIFADDNSVESATQVLSANNPLCDPQVEARLIDTKKRDTAMQLWEAQIKAIRELDGTSNPAVIPILIPYLAYPSDLNSNYIVLEDYRKKQDIETLRSKWPVFGIITRIPNAGIALTHYVEDSRNPIDYRGAAFHVLRYVDQDQFEKLSEAFNKVFGQSNTPAAMYLKGVESGRIPFHGIHYFTVTDPSLGPLPPSN
jgi:hypothetical protein